MLEIETRTNQNNGPEVIVKTKEGNLIFSKELNNLYIGYFEEVEDKEKPKEFKINKENNYIYTSFLSLFHGIKEKQDATSVTLYSDGFMADEEESTFTIRLNNDETISVILTKSISRELDSYFVCIEDIEKYSVENLFLNAFFKELETYSPHKQITIEECLYNIEQGIDDVQRTRVGVSGVNK